jgi:hypothetical protein
MRISRDGQLPNDFAFRELSNTPNALYLGLHLVYVFRSTIQFLFLDMNHNLELDIGYRISSQQAYSQVYWQLLMTFIIINSTHLRFIVIIEHSFTQGLHDSFSRFIDIFRVH